MSQVYLYTYGKVHGRNLDDSGNFCHLLITFANSWDPDQGPISSTSLRRVFVLKTSYEVRTLKIGFHQTIELCELLTFCRIFKTTI